MHVYRFRILMEDAEDFIREIEIQANSTFEDFHKAIYQSAGFDGKELASFYISDNKWSRKKEICLEDMGAEENRDDAPLLMKKCKLAQFIDDPHQRMIYVYDFLNLYEFYVELSKIVPAEKGISYPRCSKKSGEIPKVGAVLPPKSNPAFDEDEPTEEIREDVLGGKEDEDADALYFSDAEASGTAEEGNDSFEED